MAAITTTWVRRVAAGAVLAAAPALIALGTAGTSNAQSQSGSTYNYSPTPQSVSVPYPYGPAGQSWHQRHAADIQSMYQ